MGEDGQVHTHEEDIYQRGEHSQGLEPLPFDRQPGQAHGAAYRVPRERSSGNPFSSLMSYRRDDVFFHTSLRVG
jgi:hypothetical protein